MKDIPFGRPLIREEERRAVAEVLKGHILTHGPKVKEFEKKFVDYAGAEHALAVSSCTAALHLSYFYLGIGENDEVLVPAQTHVATAHSVELMGAKPIFIDSEIETGNLDINQIEENITDKTKALSVVHYLGIPVDMKKIGKIAESHNLFVVEDCALSLGAYIGGVHTGNFGDVGCFSFYPVKHITTAEGGMLVTNNEDIALEISKQRAFGIDRQIHERKIPGMYDAETLGLNYRMNELQAAIGIEQIKKADLFLKKRKENYKQLEKGLKELEEIHLLRSYQNGMQSSYYCLVFVLNESLGKKRFDIVKKLNKKGIGTSIYYPGPVPKMSYYQRKYGFGENSFPNASRISNHSIALPVGPHLGLEEMDYIASKVKEVIKEEK